MHCIRLSGFTCFWRCHFYFLQVDDPIQTSPCGVKTAPCVLIIFVFLFCFLCWPFGPYFLRVGGALCFRALLFWGVDGTPSPPPPPPNRGAFCGGLCRWPSPGVLVVPILGALSEGHRRLTKLSTLDFVLTGHRELHNKKLNSILFRFVYLQSSLILRQGSLGWSVLRKDFELSRIASNFISRWSSLHYQVFSK